MSRIQTVFVLVLVIHVATNVVAPRLFAAGEEAAAARLEQMTRRARSMTVAFAEPRASGGKANLVAKPLNRYSDRPRGILDGTFWCWRSDGRPVAFSKIEIYDNDDPSLRWFYCFASASQERIRAKWELGQQLVEQWTATSPGITLQPLLDEPTPGTNELRVASQLKQISRRFSVRLEDVIAGTKEQLRLVPRPIYEYGQSIAADARGAVFRFASKGTNPDALLLIELTRGDSARQWRYGWIQMTTGKLTAQLDDEVVWTAPYHAPDASNPSKFESWLFFHESAERR